MYDVQCYQQHKKRFKDGEEKEIVDCQHGWDYNRNWYMETIPSQENWVCDNELRVTNTFIFLRVGELLGGILSGLFTDKIGRRPTFYVAALAITLGRLVSIAAPSHYTLFLLLCTVSTISTTSMYQSPLIIAMEISDPENRAFISVVQQLAWSSGFGMLPFLMWVTGGHWIIFALITTLPGLIYFLLVARNIIESPRWLFNRNKYKRCIEELQKIAKINKTHLPNDICARLNNLPKNSETSIGYFSLFIHWRIAKNTICTAFCSGAYQLIYLIIVLNIENLGGNPLVNLFLQIIVELPGYVLSKFSAGYFGRRWTQVCGFAVTALGCLPLVALISDPNYGWLGTVISILLKFTISFTFYSMTLQSFELFPTCLRQTGLSVSATSANMFAILSPYIVHLERPSMHVFHMLFYWHLLLLQPYVVLCCPKPCTIAFQTLLLMRKFLVELKVYGTCLTDVRSLRQSAHVVEVLIVD